MTHKEIREQSQRLLLLTGIKLFGTKGYDATSIVDIETELNLTRGAITYHYKSKLGMFETTVNKYYLGRVMPSSVPEDQGFLSQICLYAGGGMSGSYECRSPQCGGNFPQS